MFHLTLLNWLVFFERSTFFHWFLHSYFFWLIVRLLLHPLGLHKPIFCLVRSRGVCHVSHHVIGSVSHHIALLFMGKRHPWSWHGWWIFDCRASAQGQFVLCYVEYCYDFFALNLWFTADLFVWWVEDGLSVSSVWYSVVDDQSQYGQLCVISFLIREICANQFRHRSRSLSAVLKDSFTEIGPIRTRMPEDIIFGKIICMVSCRAVESLMLLQRIHRFLHFQESQGFDPGFFALVCLVNNLFGQWHFPIIGKGIDLPFQGGDKIGGVLSCDVDELDHLFFERHFSKGKFKVHWKFF